MKRIALLIAAALLSGGALFAQENSKVEITGDYSYFRNNLAASSVWSGQNLNGGGGDITFFPTRHFGFKADVQGYNGFNTCPSANSTFTGCAGGNLVTYLFGPVVKYRIGKFEPFGEVLFGGAHSNFYSNACTNNSGLCSSTSATTTAFTMAVGGGLDLSLTHHFGIRLLEMDYVPTRFTDNSIGGNNTQNNFRVQTGVQFRF